MEERVLIAQNFYDDDGDLVEIPRTGLLTTSFYGQFGILDRLDVNAYVPFLVINSQEGLAKLNLEEASRTSLGNITLGLKYGILSDGPLVLSVGTRLNLPTSGDPTEMLRLQTGTEDFQQSLHMDLGFSIWPVYLLGGVSLNNRESEFSDEFAWYAGGGVSLLLFSVEAQVRSLQAFDNASISTNPALLYSAFLNNKEYLAYGGALNWHILPILGLSLGADFAAGGRNILATPSIYAAFYLKI